MTTRTPARNGAQHARSTETRRGRAAQVYERLHELIVRGTLAPGARITEADVVARLGVSRTPVRAAIQRLAHEGYVTTSSDKGRAQAVVSPLTCDEAVELLNIVGEIEGLAGYYAAQLESDSRSQLVGLLRRVNRRLEAAAQARAPRPDVIFDLDQEFHALYVERAAGPRLLQLHRLIKPQADRYIRLYVSALIERILTSVREHESIIKAIDSGRAGVAQQAVRANWRNAGGRLRRMIEVMGERGGW